MTGARMTEKTHGNAAGHALDQLAAVEAEQGLLGSLLMDNTAFDRVGDLVRAEDFFVASHRAVFGEIARQLLAGQPADSITVAAALGMPVQDVHELTFGLGSGANARRHAELVRERALSRRMLAVGEEVSALALRHAVPLTDRVDAATAQLAGLLAEQPRDEWVDAAEGMVQHVALLEERAEGKVNAIPTGLEDLDEILEGGMRPGQLIVVGARPSMGKTALAMTIGLQVAEGYSVAMLSMEMPHAELRDRMTAMLGRVSLSSVKRPKRHDLDWGRVLDGVERARKLNFIASDQGGLTIGQVRAKARNVKRLHGLNVLIVDYIGLMAGTDAGQPRAYQLEEISRGLKSLAKELDIAVLCLAQVNRRVEERTDRTPSLSDLRDSGAIEQDADVVAFVHRPIQDRPDLGPEWTHYAKVNVAKNRNGRCGALHLYYQGDQTRFASWEGDAPRAMMRAGRGGSDL